MKVWPANDTMRKVLKHPNGVKFSSNPNMSADWPSDVFTKRRLKEGVILDHPPVQPKKKRTSSSSDFTVNYETPEPSAKTEVQK